jgi:hypothetical protein
MVKEIIKFIIGVLLCVLFFRVVMPFLAIYFLGAFVGKILLEEYK